MVMIGILQQEVTYKFIFVCQIVAFCEINWHYEGFIIVNVQGNSYSTINPTVILTFFKIKC